MGILPDEITNSTSIERAAERLRELLHFEGSLPLAAVKKAIENERYATALMAMRKNPELLERLLASAEPRNEPSVGPATNAAKSILKWGMKGLEVAKPWIISKRLAACKTCPFEEPAPDGLSYRGAKLVVGQAARVCSVCGCLTNTKAAMAHEKCPEKDPANPDTSRWGEPWVAPDSKPRWPWS
ncbi:hypothetical protein RGQ15_16425 [Paracoccus sp. MBLB3053]|uniref:Uncharacterized protein n=1 Tax=Paracoccus aurantius TaxID=3073814 RepID=A0ABU2HX11_9RHOB|nr:hypothetical protein [Paracoccus sp. MBLB3053]MDS9469149.1 hypothetical protein [Paracoccus sp. MBLB3053]